jgi:hypothetical protein
MKPARQNFRVRRNSGCGKEVAKSIPRTAHRSGTEYDLTYDPAYGRSNDMPETDVELNTESYRSDKAVERGENYNVQSIHAAQLLSFIV